MPKAKKVKKKVAGKHSGTATKPTTQIDWQWLPRRQHEGKSFGNPALYATPQTVASLVRETGQNSLDAASSKKVVMRFRLIDLPSGCERRERFESRLSFLSGLRPHLEAVARAKKTQSAARVGSALRELDQKKGLLRLLVVEDYGTKGLVGGEFDSNGNFCALVRDSENSLKTDDTAGGSFGLGSKTLWSCSGLLTVLFASSVKGSEKLGIRTIGKADLGYHETMGGFQHGYVGPGFFGKPVADGGAESSWITDDEMLRDMCLTRSAPEGSSQTGTSALILAFDDPESDDEDSAETLEKLRRAIARNFWPAMLVGSLSAYVRHERGDYEEQATDELVDPKLYVPSLADAYAKHLNNETVEKLKIAGDVVSVPIAHMLPATREEGGVSPQHAEQHAEARLIIRLAGDEATDDADVSETVALARGRAMVTQYMPRKGVALNARNFHAFLLAGTLAGPGPSQSAAEQFLRHAEPPSHDEWKLWSGLKARYAHGAGKRLEELFREITATLAQHVTVAPEASDDGPDALKRLLAIPSVKVGKQSKWRLKQASAEATGDIVEFAATFEIDKPAGVLFTPRVVLAGESGTVALELYDLKIDAVPIESGTVTLTKGDRVIELTGKAKSTMPGIRLDECAIRLSAALAKTEAGDVDE